MADYTYYFPYGQNYDYGDSPLYKDEDEAPPEPSYRHQRALYKLMPAGEALLDAELIAVT